MKSKIQIVLLMLTTGLIACWAIAAPASNGEEAIAGQSVTLEVSTEEMELLGIKVEPVSLSSSGSSGELTLRVAFAPDGEWLIKTPLSGILHRSFVQQGDRVKAGDPLMVIRSAEVVNLKQDYLKARAEVKLQESSWRRDQRLSEAGSISTRRWQETQHSYDTARAELAGLKARLLIAGFSQADLEQLVENLLITPDLILRAPVNGIVLERPAQLGEHLEGSELLLRLGEPDKLILQGVVARSAAAYISEGDSLVLKDQNISAVLVFVSSVVDVQTQTVDVRAEPEKDAQLWPGQLSRWMVQARDDQLTVPASAIIKLHGADVVYVAVPAGFKPRQVRVRNNGRGDWIVTAGLSVNEQVAVSGTATLKGMSLGMGGGQD